MVPGPSVLTVVPSVLTVVDGSVVSELTTEVTEVTVLVGSIVNRRLQKAPAVRAHEGGDDSDRRDRGSESPAPAARLRRPGRTVLFAPVAPTGRRSNSRCRAAQPRSLAACATGS